MKRPPRILAVDDQPANLILVRRVLEPAGYLISEARSGGETLAVAQEKAPDLVLLDMHLPDMHGLDVIRRLRESPRSAAIPVVAMSALATPEDQALWVQAGCAGTIEKPIDVHALPQQVARFLPGGRGGEGEGPIAVEPRPDRLGELLVANLLISPEQLAQATAAQVHTGKRLGQVLVEQGALSEDDIAWALSHQLGYPYVFLTHEIVDAETVQVLPELFLRERRVLPILKFGQEMTLAMVDPTDQQTVEEAAARTGLQVKRALALASNIEEMHNYFYPDRGTTVATAASSGQTATEAQYFQFHLVQAMQQGGTEIHFDPASDGQARVRYRLQGLLVDRPGQPADLHAAILRHLRELTRAGDASATTATVTLPVGEREVLMVATFLPTIAGEAATVIIQPQHAEAPDLGALGVADEMIQPVRRALAGTAGVVLVGCGDRWVRSMLLHGLIPAGLRGKIWALETASVYRRSTMNQTVLLPGASAADHIAAAVEAGADLIAVDDVTRREALVAAVGAGRTRVVLAGHPASDAAALLGEVLDGAGAALVAATLRAVIVARAIRLLCPACKQPTNGESGAFQGQRTFATAGCEACGFTGFKGRRLLLDVWVADGEARRLLRAGQSQAVFDEIARHGSHLQDAGRALVLDGLASADEFSRVVG